MTQPNPPATTNSSPGFLTVTVGGHEFTLTGSVGFPIIVDYHADFKDAINLGSIASITTEIANAFGESVDINSAFHSFSGVPGLESVVQALTTATVCITDIGINTATSNYRFGFALDFRANNPPVTIGPITLDAFGLLLTHKATKQFPKPA